MDLGLSGKKALVTGATKGIGRAIAETLLAEGASVAICARNAEPVDAAVAEMSSLGTVHGAAVDAADGDALTAWVASSADQLGGIDIYVHNTSGKPARSTRCLDQQLQDRPDVARPRCRRRDRTRSPTVADRSSASARPPSPNTSHRDRAATARSRPRSPTGRSARRRCSAPRASAATSCRPGPIFIEGGDWNMIKDNMAPFFEATQKNHPGGDLGTAQDVADVVTFLASSRAKHVNGVNITVDGGFLKRVDY
jgi:3-oxoacyl-[acyl-carrier protein] reductase